MKWKLLSTKKTTSEPLHVETLPRWLSLRLSNYYEAASLAWEKLGNRLGALSYGSGFRVGCLGFRL